jgi:hypothetical protein
MKTCEMTMSDNGNSPTGNENYWKCGRPAKAIVIRWGLLDGKTMFVCGIHARAHDKIAKKYGFKLSEPLTK